jgi:UDP-N-acetylglucosamine--N-acetylmuramyl-(pentapeptide) pyrophosphoryl-undecaprenol N-acetylglucosamine transferase
LLKVIISGGGTGGHIFPAIAIADQVRELHPQAHFLFVGAQGKMEMTKVPEAGYAIEGLPIRGFQRNAMWRNVDLPWRLVKSLVRAGQVLRRFSPHVVVGVGGYASGPVLAVAQALGMPTLIQEQNSHPGVTNRLLARRAAAVCVAYEGMERWFPKGRLHLTGNPVRLAMVQTQGKRTEALHMFGLREGVSTVLVTGGSLGARGINMGVLAALAQWKAAGLQVLWQTGEPFYTKANEAVLAQGYPQCKVHAFIGRMDLAYAAADLVVARAGAMSVSELCLVCKPAVLVPLPSAAEDHQTSNARALSDAGAAVLVADHKAPAELGAHVLRLAADATESRRLAVNMQAFGRPNATRAIAEQVITLAGIRA